MLYQLDIPNTLVMLYDEENGKPTHTVVEVRLPDFRAVADPVYDIVYTTSHGQFWGWMSLEEIINFSLTDCKSLLRKEVKSPRSPFTRKGRKVISGQER